MDLREKTAIDFEAAYREMPLAEAALKAAQERMEAVHKELTRASSALRVAFAKSAPVLVEVGDMRILVYLDEDEEVDFEVASERFVVTPSGRESYESRAEKVKFKKNFLKETRDRFGVPAKSDGEEEERSREDDEHRPTAGEMLS